MKHPARCPEVTMATQSEPPTHAPVTLRGSVEKTYHTYHKDLPTPTGGRDGREQLKRHSEQNESQLAMAGKADVPGIS